MRKHIEFMGHNLKTLSGTAEVTTASGAVKTKNVWENHGLFPSRSLAAAHATKVRSGKKYHIEGLRLDVTPIEPPRREDKAK